MGMHLLRELRLWGLGASAGLVAAARAPAARPGPRRPPRLRAPPADPRPCPGLRLRTPLPASPRSQRQAAACRDPPPAHASTMERTGAGEPGQPSGPGGVTGARGRGRRSALGLGEGPTSPPHCAPSAWSATPRLLSSGAPLPAQRGTLAAKSPVQPGCDQCCL